MERVLEKKYYQFNSMFRNYNILCLNVLFSSYWHFYTRKWRKKFLPNILWSFEREVDKLLDYKMI